MQDKGKAPAGNVSESQGVQVGWYNVQNNTWVPEPVPDPASLRMLSPHAAAERIRRLTPDGMLDLLAKSSTRDAADLLKILLDTDQAKALAVLADINPSKATELIKQLSLTAIWLEVLETYRGEGGRNGWLGYPETEVCLTEHSFFQVFEGGVISGGVMADDEAHAVRSDFAEYIDQVGSWELWRSTGPESAMELSAFGGSARTQDFVNSDGRYLMLCSFGNEVHGVSGEIGIYYTQMGGVNSWLGPPGLEEEETPQGWTQFFVGGIIFDRDEYGALAVPIGTAELLMQNENMPERLGWPVSEYRRVEDSSDYIQFFDNGVITVRDGECEIWVRANTSES